MALVRIEVIVGEKVTWKECLLADDMSKSIMDEAIPAALDLLTRDIKQELKGEN